MIAAARMMISVCFMGSSFPVNAFFHYSPGFPERQETAGRPAGTQSGAGSAPFPMPDQSVPVSNRYLFNHFLIFWFFSIRKSASRAREKERPAGALAHRLICSLGGGREGRKTKGREDQARRDQGEIRKWITRFGLRFGSAGRGNVEMVKQVPICL